MAEGDGQKWAKGKANNRGNEHELDRKTLEKIYRDRQEFLIPICRYTKNTSMQ